MKDRGEGLCGITLGMSGVFVVLETSYDMTGEYKIRDTVVCVDLLDLLPLGVGILRW